MINDVRQYQAAAKLLIDGEVTCWRETEQMVVHDALKFLNQGRDLDDLIRTFRMTRMGIDHAACIDQLEIYWNELRKVKL